MTLACVSSVLLGVLGEVEGVGDDDTFSEVTAVVIWCVVVVGGCGVLLFVVTLSKSFFAAVTLVWCAALVVVCVTCSDAEAVVVSLQTVTAHRDARRVRCIAEGMLSEEQAGGRIDFIQTHAVYILDSRMC